MIKKDNFIKEQNLLIQINKITKVEIRQKIQHVSILIEWI